MIAIRVVTGSAHKEDALGCIHPGRLVAFDAMNFKELWRDDDVSFFAKFPPATVADGNVFLATFTTHTAGCVGQPDPGLGWLIVYGVQ